jgi:hypothetical protein
MIRPIYPLINPAWIRHIERPKRMASLKQLKLAGKSVQKQQRIVQELNRIVEDIQRSEKTVLELQAELMAANVKYPSPRTTREDIGYLTELLKCANRKLIWEKNLASLQKRTPGVLEELMRLMSDPQNPPDDAMKLQMMTAFQALQAAMEKLKNFDGTGAGGNN